METSVDATLSPRHRTLMLIAKAAGILAYVALVILVIQGVGALYGGLTLARIYHTENLLQQQRFDAQTLSYILTFVNRLLTAVIFWVLLTGLALGLRMVIETDVNYRLGGGEAQDD